MSIECNNEEKTNQILYKKAPNNVQHEYELANFISVKIY